jgi:type II secretory pathway pseudopilin PulG
MKNKRGAALMQVLLVTAILAGIATFILRASLSRTSNARRTRRTISAQLLIDSCMAEVNTLWSAKTPEAFFTDMNNCKMHNNLDTYICKIDDAESSSQYKVVAKMTGSGGNCQVSYTVKDESGFSHL